MLYSQQRNSRHAALEGEAGKRCVIMVIGSSFFNSMGGINRRDAPHRSGFRGAVPPERFLVAPRERIAAKLFHSQKNKKARAATGPLSTPATLLDFPNPFQFHCLTAS